MTVNRLRSLLGLKTRRQYQTTAFASGARGLGLKPKCTFLDPYSLLARLARKRALSAQKWRSHVISMSSHMSPRLS
jgi:hypothetical protein